MRTPYLKKTKKPPLLPAVQVEGKPVCPGCRMRDQAAIVSYGLAHEQQASYSGNQNPGNQLALDDFLGEAILPGKYKFIAKCQRCGIRFYYTKDI